MRGVWLLSILLPLVPGIKADGSLYPPGLMPLINHANSLLSAGKFGDAATAYSQAIEQSPSDYVLYYKRATAYFSLNKHPSALQDFGKVLELTSDSFDTAHLMKARIHAKDGNWTEAKGSLGLYKSSSKSEKTSIEELDSQITEGEAAHKKATQAARAKLWTACEEAASAALSVASHSLEIRQQRAECSLAAGDLEMAVGDLTRLIHLTAPSTSQFMRIFRLTYFLLPVTSADSAMSNLKQCLHYDPDSKECFAARRLVKNFGKTFDKLQDLLNSEDWKGVINLFGKGTFTSKFDQALDAETTQEVLGLPPWLTLTPPRKSSPRREVILRNLCKAYVRIGQPKKGEAWCQELGQMRGGSEDADALLGQGEVLLANEQYEEAVRVMEKAWDACGRKDKFFQQRLIRAQKLLKQSKQKDYYKVLGVSRDADQKTIKKAFRKAAVKAHPDKGGSEAKMAAVNEAYEVLSNPELRQRFDNGDDPNDPMAQQGGHPFQGQGGNPFAHFFQGGGHRGGEGFKFTYGFN